ncbi:MAG: ABC transporter permease [Balneolales bacterium]
MKATSLIARRYLTSKKHISLISTLTMISVSGVTLGTALLIIVLSVFNGFFDVVKSLLLAHDPDIRIESTGGRAFNITDEDFDEIGEIPEIVNLSRYVEGKTIISYRGDRHRVVNVKGVETRPFRQLANLDETITSGKLDFDVQNQKPGILIGQELALELGLDVGQEVVLMSAAGMQKALTQFSGPRAFVFDVRGVYHMKQITASSVIFLDLSAGQRLFNFRGTITGIDINLEDHQQADQVKEQLEATLGGDFNIRTWYDLQKPLYDVMNLEKWGAYLILMIIILVAILNIIGSLTMIVIQKTRDIGILRSIGFKKSDIRNIFLKQGFYIGLTGCILGGSLGLLLSWLQQTYGLVKLAGAEAFIITAYPVSIAWTDVALVLGGSLVLCVIASLYPSSRASKIESAEAVRYE